MFAYVQGDDVFFLFFFFSYFSKKMGSDISCKMSPDETDCMKCQTPFSAKSKTNLGLLRVCTVCICTN